MSILEDLLTGIVADPLEETRWLVLADWLEEFDDPRRSELLRLHRRLLATWCEPDQHPERVEWHARMVALLVEGVRPCVPQKTLGLPSGVEMTFSFIPPGQFLMGSDHPAGYEEEKPVRRVTLTRGFYLGVYPVTQPQWEAIMCTNPSHFPGPNRPVDSISWGDCQEFAEVVTAYLNGRVTVRLPTEAEWEYACRAGTTSEYHFGDQIRTGLAHYDGNETWNGSPKRRSRKETTEVGTFPANAWGLFDVHGNVWEWCQDAYDDAFYAKSPDQDPLSHNTHAGENVLRGGSWFHNPVCCRSAYRYGGSPEYGCTYYGCRVAFDVG